MDLHLPMQSLLTATGAVVVMIVWWLDLQLPMQSEHITTKVMSLNPAQSIHHCVITFVSDLR